MLATSQFYPPKSVCTRKETFMQRPFCRDQRSQNSNVMCTLLFDTLWPSIFRSLPHTIINTQEHGRATWGLSLSREMVEMGQLSAYRGSKVNVGEFRRPSYDYWQYQCFGTNPTLRVYWLSDIFHTHSTAHTQSATLTSTQLKAILSKQNEELAKQWNWRKNSK